MARIIKKPEVRRNEILDTAQRLVYTKGYEQMTVNEIIDDLHISKGVFYHYFDSKQALLEALIERSGEAGIQLIRPILTDSDLNALQKLQGYFDSAMRWKTAQRTTMITLLKAWYADENAILRQKELAAGKKVMLPLLSDVVRQGISEGLLATQHPEQIAEVLVTLILGLSDALAELILLGQGEPVNFPRVEATLATYTRAIEQVLGAAPNTIQLIESETMREWFTQTGAQ